MVSKYFSNDTTKGILALTINRLGMSLMSMNKPTEKVSFLDEIDIALTVDNRKSSGHSMTSVDLTIQPIVFRASLRDINLITAIVTRGMELSSGDKDAKASAKKSVRPSAQQYPKSGKKSKSSRPPSGPRKAQAPVQLIMTTEKVCMFELPDNSRLTPRQLKATFDGFRLILIGDIHEFPLLHLNTKMFTVTAADWSGEVR